MVRKVNLREEKMVGNQSLRHHYDRVGSLGYKKIGSVITKVMSKLNSGDTGNSYDYTYDYTDSETGETVGDTEVAYWGEWDAPTEYRFEVDLSFYVYKNGDLDNGAFITIPCEIIYDTEDNTYYIDPDGDLSDVNKICREIKAGTKKRKKSVKESSSPSDMGMKSLRRDFTGLSRDERKKKGYLYFTKHGLGPGTLPKDIDLVASEDLDNYLTAIYLDRPLSSEELDYYDIYPETQNSRFMHLIKEGTRKEIKESAEGSDVQRLITDLEDYMWRQEPSMKTYLGKLGGYEEGYYDGYTNALKAVRNRIRTFK